MKHTNINNYTNKENVNKQTTKKSDIKHIDNNTQTYIKHTKTEQ